MSFLPDTIVAVDATGRPLRDKCLHRLGASSRERKALSEADWDHIICANVSALAGALRAAGVLEEDSTLRVLGRQIDAVDVLLAEVPRYAAGDADEGEGDAESWGEPRRLVLLEDKLVRSPEAKRQVLAQVLDYAQRAQQRWTTDTLCAVLELPGRADWLRRHASRVDVMLAQGDLLLVIAGDDIDEDLLRLARRFAAANDPLSLNELCLVSMALYQRDGERFLVPHVVSAVERHQRPFTIRVTVQGPDGAPIHARVERDLEADVEAARRGALPVNADVKAFLEKVKRDLDLKLLGEGSLCQATKDARKTLTCGWRGADGDRVNFKVHFGGYERSLWSPIQVGLEVESKHAQRAWHDRAKAAFDTDCLPPDTELSARGKQSVTALKSYQWSENPAELTDALRTQVVETLLRFEEVFRPAQKATPGPTGNDPEGS